MEILEKINLTSLIFILLLIGYIKIRASEYTGSVSKLEKKVSVVTLLTLVAIFIVTTIISIWI